MRFASLCGVGAFGLFLAACASKDEGPACGGITGTYVDTDTRDPANPGDCAPMPGESDPSTVTVIANGATAQVSFQSLPGACPAVVNGCSVTASQCRFQTAAGAILATVQFSWTFSSAGYSGYSSIGFTASSPTGACAVNFRSSGARR